MAIGTTGAPDSSASRPIPGRTESWPAGPRAAALAVHRDHAAAVEDPVCGERLLVGIAAPYREHAPCV